MDGRNDRRSPSTRILSAIACCLACTASGAAADAASGPGTTLRVGVTTITAIVDWKDDRPVGPMPDVWAELCRRLDLKTDFVRIDTFANLIKAVERGDVDVALGPLAITEERERLFDLTHPVFHSGMRIAVRQKRDTGLLSAARSLLSWQLLTLLALVVVLAVVSGHLLWWFEHDHNPRSFPPEYPRGVIEAMWWITSTIITGGCDDKHVDGPIGRILAFAWMAGGIGLIATFTSVLTATMTTEQVAGVIHGPRDLAGRTVGVQLTAVSKGSVVQRGGIPLEFPTLRDAVDALGLGMVDAVVGEAETLSHLVTEVGAGRLKLIGPIFDAFDYGMALPNGSPFREELNASILRMREDGTIERTKERWLGKHE
jgi:polar amino acid transport system substrate-binding protein